MPRTLVSFVEKSSRKKKTLVHFAVIKTPHFAYLKHIRWSTKDVLCCYGPIVLIFEKLNSHRHIYIYILSNIVLHGHWGGAAPCTNPSSFLEYLLGRCIIKICAYNMGFLTCVAPFGSRSQQCYSSCCCASCCVAVQQHLEEGRDAQNDETTI